MLFSKKEIRIIIPLVDAFVAFADVKIITVTHPQLEVNVSINNKSNQEYGIPHAKQIIGKGFQNVLVNAQ